MNKAEWKYAILVSAALTVFNMINDSRGRAHIVWSRMVMYWALIFFFLLITWVANSQIQALLRKIEKDKVSIINLLIILLANLFILFGLLFFLDMFHVVRIKFIGPGSNYLLVSYQAIVGICLICIIQFAVHSSMRSQEILLQNQMLHTENIRSQFEILKQQISPHFLFNSLSTLRSMIRLQNPHSEEYVIKLSEMYRQILIQRNIDVIPLKDELDFVNDYIYMLNARFENMLTIAIDVPPEYLEYSLPTFSLQLLLENCIKHNVLSNDKPLNIRIYCHAPETLIIENNLQIKVSQVERSGYGLENLSQRYKLLGCENGVRLFSDEKTFRVSIKMLQR